MQPLKTYDRLAHARQRVFEWVRPLGAEKYARPLPIGLGTLGRTLTHIMTSEWVYVQRIQGGTVPPRGQRPIVDEKPPPFAALEAMWIQQAGRTRAALDGVRDWTTEMECRVAGEAPEVINASPEDIFTQLCFHEVHHRAQAMTMLKQLGVAAEDLDVNALTYERCAMSA